MEGLAKELTINDIKWRKSLGGGASGTVWAGEWHGTKVAVKEWPRYTMSTKMLQQFIHEVELISSLSHPNIVLFMGSCATSKHVCIVMELLDGGSLYDVGPLPLKIHC